MGEQKLELGVRPVVPRFLRKNYSPILHCLALRQPEPGDNVLEPRIVAERIIDGIGDHSVGAAAMLLGTSTEKFQHPLFLSQVRIDPGHPTGISRFALFRRLEFLLPVAANTGLLVRTSVSSQLLLWRAPEFL